MRCMEWSRHVQQGHCVSNCDIFVGTRTIPLQWAAIFMSANDMGRSRSTSTLTVDLVSAFPKGVPITGNAMDFQGQI